MRSALKQGRSTSFYGHQLHHILPEQQEEVLEEILSLNRLLPEANVLLPETEEGAVPLLQIWTTDINFEPTDDAPTDVINFTHFREVPFHPDGTPAAHPQALFFCSQDGEDDPISCQFELGVSGLLLLNRNYQADTVYLALHVEDTFTVCRFERRDGRLQLIWVRHRTEDGEALQLLGTDHGVLEDAEERIRKVREASLAMPASTGASIPR